MTKRQTTIITALSIIAFLLALIVSGCFWFRLDLTKNKAYTISKVSRNLSKEIPDPVNITYYVSDKLKSITPITGEIEDTLREYAAFSRGKIRLTVRDPVRSELSPVVESLGLKPQQVPVVEEDQQSVVMVYSGIVIEYLDNVAVLPWVSSTAALEYDLTSRIRSLVTDRERWIALIVGDSFRQWENFKYLDMTLENAGYRVRQIFPGEEIPDITPALFVLGGAEDLDEWALYRIDRYIQMGGKVLFAVKGVYLDINTLQARHQQDLGLLDMIGSYGVTIRPELALDQNALTLQYQTASPSGVPQYRIVRYPLWIGVLSGNANYEHPVSGAGFNGLDLYWASPLELHSSSSVEVFPLFTSSALAWSMKENLSTDPDVPYMLTMEADETQGVKILGASLSGTFPSFFRGADKPVREGSDEELPDLPARPSPARIIVVGDTDFATNLIQNTNAVHNLDFLLRVADWLSSDDDIIGIRNRQPQTGRFDKILDASRRVAAGNFSQILNVAIMPLFVIAAGLFLSRRRRTRAGGVAAPAAASENDPIKEKNDDI